MRLTRGVLLLSVFLSVHSVLAQTAALPSFQQQIASAFSAKSFPSSVALSGNASWIAGSLTDSGTLNLQVSADGSTNEGWSLSATSHSFVKGPLSYTDFSRVCTYTDSRGKQRDVLGPNCLQSLPWFFPSFVLQPAYAAVLTVVDQTSDADTAQGLEKLTYSTALSALPSASSVQLSPNFTIYYDAKTSLPARLVYQQAFDGDDSRGVEVAIAYSNYSLESGFMMPHHFQRYVQRTLNADFTVSAATIQ